MLERGLGVSFDPTVLSLETQSARNDSEQVFATASAH